MPTAAHKLHGVQLQDGWTAVRMLAPNPGGTGGHFSVGYEADHPVRGRGFLKALDFAGAFGTGGDVVALMQALTAAYLFERDTLIACRNRQLDRVATPIADGIAKVAGYPIADVPYLIFDMADGDIRRHMSATHQVEVAWLLRCLHHVATGLKQLHSAGIAHQDLKPSNVLVFGGEESRIGDLGRASRQGIAAPHDGYSIAGDMTYAPPELLYGQVDPDWKQRRVGCDIYHLGNLVVFLFSRVNVTHAMVAMLDAAFRPGAWTGTYLSVLPHVRDVFNRVMDMFETEVARVAPRLAPDIARIARQLGEPDPHLRGDPQSHAMGAPHSLERYISRLDALAYRARLGLI
jgi:eukaryotic-like serine/threonine-protein kinase